MLENAEGIFQCTYKLKASEKKVNLVDQGLWTRSKIDEGKIRDDRSAHAFVVK